MNIIPEKKYGRIGHVNNMDLLIKLKLNKVISKNKNKSINIILDNSLSTIGECFLKLKNGIKKLVTFLPSNYIINIYTNQKNIYSGNLDLNIISKSLDKIKCKGFNNYQKYIDVSFDNCIIFTDEDVKFPNVRTITDEDCLTENFLFNIVNDIILNLGNFVLKLYPINNNFIKNIYDQEKSDSIIINNLVKDKEYNFLINMDILSIENINLDILELKLIQNNKIIEEQIFKMIFVKENHLINNEVLIYKALFQGNKLEKGLKKLYQDKNLLEIKKILFKLKNLYNFGKIPILNDKYQRVLNCILYLEEEIKSESLKSIELNYEMKYNHFDLNI